MLRLAVHLLGAPHIERDGVSIHVERRKGLALLAYLTLSAHPISRDELATLLWPELGQQGARAMLRYALSSLHRGLGHGWLVIENDHVALAVRPDLWVDVLCFRTLLAQVAAHAHREFHFCDVCVAALTEAAELYNARFLAGFALADAPDFELWQTQQAELLQCELAQVLEQLAHVHASYGRRHFRLALDYAQRWLSLDPLHEPACRMLMQLNAHTGDRAAALHQYDQCVQVLAAELGVEPSPETKRLAEQIRSDPLASIERTAAAVTGALAAATQRGDSLPVQATPFMGRERELEQVTARLVDPECRLLTIVGPGGIGKTRLGLQAVQYLADFFAHGIFFVDLASVNAVDLLAPTLLRALDAPGYGAREAQPRLVDFLRRKQVLLVLDSFEHLLEGVNLLTDLLHAAPGVKLLVTSRVRLNVREEWLEPLTGLDVPDTTENATFQQRPLTAADLEDYSATRLFVHCVRRLQPGFAPYTPQDIQALVTISRLLEGMPLGIELVAPWLHMLPVTEIEREMVNGLSLLSTSLHDMPARHRSMRAVFGQSWQLLSVREQHLLRQLAVFRGGCTRDAAVKIAGAELTDLAGLVDKSWLRVNVAGRYEMHELVRQYCEERLEAEHGLCGEAPDEVRRRHGIYYGRNLATPIHKMNYTPEVIDEVMAEFGNVQAGLRWAALSHDVTAIRWMGMTLYFVAEMLGQFHEVDQLYQMVVDLLAPETADRSDRQRWQEAVLMQGYFLWHQSNLCIYLAQMERSRVLAESNLTLLEQVDPSDDQRFLVTMCRLVLAIRALRSGDFENARRQMIDVLARFQDPTMPWKIYERPMESQHLQSQAYSFLGHIAYHQGDYVEAERLMRHSRVLREPIGERREYAHQASWLVRVLQVKGDYLEAEVLARDSLHAIQSLGDRISEANALLTLGRLECDLGRPGPAQTHLQQCLEMAKQWGHLHLILEALSELGRLALALGNPTKARELGEEALAAYAQAGPVHSNNLSSVLVMLGWACLAAADMVVAKQAFLQALHAQGRPAVDTMEALAGMAQVLVEEGNLRDAVMLLSLVERHRYTSYTLRVQAGQTLAGLQPHLPQDVSSALQIRSGELGLDAVVVGLLQRETA